MGVLIAINKDGMDKTKHIISALLCWFLSGLGTCITAFLGGSMNSTVLIIGIVQIVLTALFGIGWLWALVFAILHLLEALK